VLRFVTGARILGLLVVVAAALAANWMLTSSVFRLDQAQVSGEVRYTDVQAVLAAAGIGAADHPNVALLHSDEMRRQMLTFPAVADAQVDVELPNHVSITLTERQPVFALRRGTSLFLVDADGLVLATAEDPTFRRARRAGNRGRPDEPGQCQSLSAAASIRSISRQCSSSVA